MVELLRWACRLSISGTSRAGQSISGSASKRIAGERRTEARIALFVVVLMQKPCGCFLPLLPPHPQPLTHQAQAR